MSYKETLSLPRTEYPQKADLTKNEPLQLKRWEETGIYDKIRALRKGAPVYLLHDGPPYANGAVHMGTGINKILKDVVVKYKTMRGFDSPYVPGWDCHGLPIEHKVMTETRGKNLPIMKIRELCEAYARKYIGVQRSQFKRLHVFGEWERPYLTIDHSYESGVVETFRDLVAGGYVYKKLKPIHWCMNCETALAEAELEYRDERSHSIYVRFPVSEEVKKLFGLGGKEKVFFLIWTTTPWTLPANVAIAVGPNYEYDAVRLPSSSEYLIFADARVEPVMREAGIADYEIICKVKGREFENKTYRHNFIEREGRFILADFVSLEDGTGSVHIAPGHGAEDYEIGMKYDLPVLSPVDSKGRFTDEFPLMKGVNVFDANKKINDLLVSNGYMLKRSEFTHSYPTCWRCKEPVIFRATEQWFISVDHDGFREKALAAIKSVKWIPDWGEVRIASMVEERPDWCISRQRSWGVPIPAFICNKCGASLVNAEIVDNVAKVFAKEGSNSWFARDAAYFLPNGAKCGKCAAADFKKENDIFDVWFESGSSWKILYERNFPFPCDLYLEGTDQHRGWFQLSLIPSVATKGVPPFKAVLTHGFMVDEEGMKISKSKPREGKGGLTPEEKKRDELYMFFADAYKAAEQFGADVLRLWTASVDYTLDVRLSPEIIERRQGVYRKIRNTFRHMLGNLHDFKPETALPFDELDEIDRWLLWQLEKLRNSVTDAYESFQFYTVYHEIHNFCVVALSSFYLDIQKDLLYCGGAGKSRRSSQTAMYMVTDTLARLVAPILAYSAEEVWKYLPADGKRPESVHLADWPKPFDHPAISNEKMHGKWETFIKLRALVYREVEELRNSQNLGSSQQVEADLYFKSGVPETLVGQEDMFAAVLIASCARFHAGDVPGGRRSEDADPEAAARTVISKYGKCERCWNYRAEVGSFGDHPTLCGRCREVVGASR
jgi:isoleucyl-tRNA synthetase